jgi:hypothetical protein
MWRERLDSLVDRARTSVDTVARGEGSITTRIGTAVRGLFGRLPDLRRPPYPQVPDGPPPGTVEVAGGDAGKLANDLDVIQERNLRALLNLPGGVILRRNGDRVDDPRELLGEVRPTDSVVAYRQGSLVTTGEQVNDVLKALRELFGDDAKIRTIGGATSTVRRIDFLPPAGAAASDPAEVAARLVERSNGQLEVSVDHVVYLAQRYMFGPGSDPVPASPPPVPAALQRDPGLLVTVIDTGLYDETAPPFGAPPQPAVPDWVGAARTTAALTDFDRLDIDGDLALDSVAGHGSFAADLVNQLAPTATIDVVRVGNSMGVLTEYEVAERIADWRSHLKDGHQAHLLNLSLGGHSLQRADEGRTGGMLGVRKELEALRAQLVRQQADLLVVCAAGNNGVEVPFYPAALAEHLEYVASVGAVDEKGTVAAFSNYGRWVKFWANGVDRVAFYPPGWFRYGTGAPAAHFTDSAASWSGTSFATPTLVGLLAKGWLAAGGTRSLSDVLADLVANGQPAPASAGGGTVIL